MVMILIGAELYLLEVIFYLWKKYPYDHAVRHFFVPAAAVCHYMTILMEVYGTNNDHPIQPKYSDRFTVRSNTARTNR